MFDWLHWSLVALLLFLLLVFASVIVWRTRRQTPKVHKTKVKMSDRALAPDDLLLGALYALEQSGLLVNDAAILLEAKRYSTAGVIGLFAIEEVGRHKILLDLWRASISGKPITRSDVTKACEGDHVAKQRRGQSSLLYRMASGDQMDTLVRMRNDPSISPEKRLEARRMIEQIDERNRKRQPNVRHERRMKALYVGLDDESTWTRPCDLDRQVCADDVNSAIEAYTGARLRVEEAATVHGDVQLADAVAALHDAPMFPQSPRLSLEALLLSTGRASG